MDFTAKYGKAWFNSLFDFPAMHYDGQRLIIRAIDRAGNTVTASPDFIFDGSGALPVIEHNSPLDGDLINGNFEISGLAYVEVGIAAVYWRIITPANPWDTQETTYGRRSRFEWEKIETDRNYSVPLTLDDVRDGENILEIFAEDIYGVQGQIIRNVFKVSSAVPETVVVKPAMNLWSKGNVIVQGTAWDRNGITDIMVSMDNGLSYQKADFQSRQDVPGGWSIELNTNAYADGIYSMLIRTVDKYDEFAFSSAIINIDNTPPPLDIGSPGNGSKFGGILPITGQVHDNLGIDTISVQLVNIENPAVQISYDVPRKIDYEIPRDFILMESIDLFDFPDGDYTVKVSAFDQAGNETTDIRNITILKARAASEVAIINPLPGIGHCGPLVVSGKITGAVMPEDVTLMLDRRPYVKVPVNRYGIFRYEMPNDVLQSDKPVVFSASFQSPLGEQIVSYENLVKLSSYGPVLAIDSHRDGDVIQGRPWIRGRAFIVLSEAEMLSNPDKAEYAVSKVELSFDNGRTFVPAGGLDMDTWRFRLETGEMDPGALPIVVKATFNNGQVAVRRILLTVDTRVPIINTIGPTENSAHRDTLAVYGSARDDFDIDEVTVSLRPGDKAGYAVPGFIQGLYFDAMALGGLNWSAGVGLTFFDDNVKLQGHVAQAPSGRYSGWVIGGKILANVWTQNLSQWFGPDFEFWRTSVTLGAHFAYFLMEEGEDPLWMGQFLGQWEIIKADMSFFMPKWKYFKSISLYVEPGIWFAPSDVSNNPDAWRTRFMIGFGGRISLF
jgi:hypothetical protein